MAHLLNDVSIPTIAINCLMPKWNLGFSEDVWFYEYYYHLIMWEVWQPSIKIWQPKHCLFFKVNLLFPLTFLNNDQHQFSIYLIDKYIFFLIKYWRLFESYLENCVYENINFKWLIIICYYELYCILNPRNTYENIFWMKPK